MDQDSRFQTIWRRAIKLLADLRLAIALLLLIALFSISGTVIEQGRSIGFYQANYPEDPALFGFLTWRVIGLLGLDHVYRTWWFLALLILLAASLTACSFIRQLPTLKAARRWRYYDKPAAFAKLALSAELETGSIDRLLPLLSARGYKTFTAETATAETAAQSTANGQTAQTAQPGSQKLYARKGLAGRIGPIVVHISLLLILGGGVVGALTGFLAQELIPSGSIAPVQNILDAGPLAQRQIPQDWAVQVNRFWIDYLPDGNIDQFYSDLSIVDEAGQERDRQTISVNHPLRYRGVTLYQTSWGIAGVQVQLNNSPILQLPMGQIETDGSGKFWGTWVPTKPDLSEGVSLVARDLQGLVLLYDQTGEPLGALREGMGMQLGTVTLKVVKVIGSTGLQIKADPGTPLVYGGFALLMVGVVMSYFSHSQVWAFQTGDRFYLGGKTNRAKVTFERELLQLLGALQEETATS